jgi:diaminopimelate epimerase
LWAARRGESSPVSVVTAGGDELVVAFRPAGDGYDVSLTGPAEVAFTGEWAATVAVPGRPAAVAGA